VLEPGRSFDFTDDPGGWPDIIIDSRGKVRVAVYNRRTGKHDNPPTEKGDTVLRWTECRARWAALVLQRRSWQKELAEARAEQEEQRKKGPLPPIVWEQIGPVQPEPLPNGCTEEQLLRSSTLASWAARHLRDNHPNDELGHQCIVTPATAELRARIPIREPDLFKDRELGPCYVLGYAEVHEAVAPPEPQVGRLLDTRDSDWGLGVAVVRTAFRPFPFYRIDMIAGRTKACEQVRQDTLAINSPSQAIIEMQERARAELAEARR
jgi:hypothetical protein